MKASINTKAGTHELTITIQGLHWDEIQRATFYEGEVQVRDVLKLIGHELTLALLRSKVEEAPRLEWQGQTYYRQAASLGHSHTLYGEGVLSRPLYQSSAGGATLCPLERTCRLRFGGATPLLAEVVSFKLASAPAGEVAQDFAKSHGLALSATSLPPLAQQVGQLAGEKHAAWHLEAALAPTPVAILATGVDGTTLPVVNEAHKEAMCGTIALYDKAGERVHTEYLGTMPEAGKATFAPRFTTHVERGTARYPGALHVCLGDGAQWNWEFFATHYPEAGWVLDFYPAAPHLHTAAEALFGQGPEAEGYYERWRTALRDEEGGVTRLLRSLLYYRNRATLAARAQRTLDMELNYFRQHAQLMQDADFRGRVCRSAVE